MPLELRGAGRAAPVGWGQSCNGLFLVGGGLGWAAFRVGGSAGRGSYRLGSVATPKFAGAQPQSTALTHPICRSKTHAPPPPCPPWVHAAVGTAPPLPMMDAPGQTSCSHIPCSRLCGACPCPCSSPNPSVTTKAPVVRDRVGHRQKQGLASVGPVYAPVVSLLWGPQSASPPLSLPPSLAPSPQT